MTIALFKKIIYKVLNCKREYEEYSTGDEFEKYIKLQDEIRKNEYCDINDKYSFVKNIFINFCTTSNLHNNQNKYNLLFSYGYFLSFKPNCEKIAIMELFSKCQKVYFGLLRFRELYKHTFNKLQVDCDLNLTKLDPNHKHTIEIIQNKKRYLFNIFELMKIFEEKATFNYDFIIRSKPFLNPYTNVIFSKAILYNIYFKMKETASINNNLFELYFKDNFDIYSFCINNNNILTRAAIKSYIKNLCNIELLCEIKLMLLDINYGLSENYKIKIANNFPTDVLVKAFQPFLELYYQTKYTDSFRSYYNTINILQSKICKFINYNCKFGRVIKTTSYSYFNKKYTANTNFISFYDKGSDISNFNKSHYVFKRQQIRNEEYFIVDTFVRNDILQLGKLRHEDETSSDSDSDDTTTNEDNNYTDSNSDMTIDDNISRTILNVSPSTSPNNDIINDITG